MSAAVNVQRDPNIVDALKALLDYTMKNSLGKIDTSSILHGFYPFPEKITTTDALSTRVPLTFGETETTTAAFTTKGCTGFRLDSAGNGLCALSLDANGTEGGGKLDF